MTDDIRERLERIVAQPNNASTDVDDRFVVVLRTELKRALALITAQAVEIERLETLVIDQTDLVLIDHDRRKEIASLRGALQMTSDWFAAAQAEAELYLIPDNDCNQYWFVSRMLWHLDGPTQRALKAAIDAAMEEPKP